MRHVGFCTEDDKNGDSNILQTALRQTAMRRMVPAFTMQQHAGTEMRASRSCILGSDRRKAGVDHGYSVEEGGRAQ